MTESKQQKETRIQQLVKKLEKDNRQLPVILELSANLVEVGDLEQAEDLLTRSLTLFPQNTDLLYNLGNVYFLADQSEKAHEIFTYLIKANYGFEAYFMESKTLNQQGKKSMAIVYALTAVEKAPNDFAANELIADLLMANGNFDDAKNYYIKANGINPTAKAYFNLALCKMNLKEPYEHELDQSKKLDNDYYLKNEKELADLQQFMTKNRGKND
ncbi:tetratricopeptide repeat protein [Companilactobacillus mishanensis]|uniref:Tetratricopeptide repeat protein n=1 Tax=Companilactobacillus mishanensis TaxID=2486008 RepID=A0ABW9P496_9LACO|nr:tetratricopeptide repeat protein [Companilactobacillus mishanensis]MQS44068.1 tetratricopeptide repeat protein [Companilactobacillus mishanensis]